ncbi:MAG: hydrogenase nickel incorporation protein HypB [Planctomycetes bacterium]|nr:hydrogenase nickel incorporation protein HypB [Planctomycetota bacterium]
MKISLNKKILDKNEECAMQNSEFFADNDILCLNVISSPGSGKTTILSQTIRDLTGEIKIAVIEGDIRTDIDAKKIRAAGASAVQIETKGSCHLSAQQVTGALMAIPAAGMDVIFIENVGNLVCPSDFVLGEDLRVVVLSVPEGDDKPIKYPGTFAKADVILINKIDLIDYIDFSLERVIADIRVVNDKAEILQLSATTGEGMENWYNWLRSKITQ